MAGRLYFIQRYNVAVSGAERRHATAQAGYTRFYRFTRASTGLPPDSASHQRQRVAIVAVRFEVLFNRGRQTLNGRYLHSLAAVERVGWSRRGWGGCALQGSLAGGPYRGEAEGGSQRQARWPRDEGREGQRQGSGGKREKSRLIAHTHSPALRIEATGIRQAGEAGKALQSCLFDGEGNRPWLWGGRWAARRRWRTEAAVLAGKAVVSPPQVVASGAVTGLSRVTGGRNVRGQSRPRTEVAPKNLSPSLSQLSAHHTPVVSS